MGRGKLIALCAAVTVTVVASLTVWQMAAARARKAEARLPSYEHLLTSPDPSVRLRAATAILNLRPTRQIPRIVRAEALIELSQFSEARRDLDLLRVERTEHMRRVLTLHADSLLRDAAQRTDYATKDNVDLVTPQIEELLSQVAGIRGLMGAAGAPRAEVLTAEAREMGIRAALLALQAASQPTELAPREGQTVDDQGLGAARAGAAGIQTRIDELNREIERICQQAIALDGQAEQPKTILFDRWMREGQFDQARGIASQLTQLPKLHGRTIGPIAHTLLHLDELHGQPVTDEDVRIAEQLLLHPELTDRDHTTCQLARLVLLVKLGKAKRVEELARRMLNTPVFAGHEKVICTLAKALIDQGRTDEALAIMQRRAGVQTPLVKFTLGQAYLAGGNRALGHEALRQALELDSQLLPARLMLAESLTQIGYIVEAGDDIRAAAEISPDHVRVLRLQARHAVESLDHQALIRMLDRKWPDTRALVRWHDVAVVAAMVLDDQDLTSELVELAQGFDAKDALALIAEGWLQTDSDKRARVAAVLACTIQPRIDIDPLERPRPPVFAARERPTRADSQQDQEVEKILAAVGLISRNDFVPSPHQNALDLVEFGLARFPGQPRLLALSGELNLWLGRVTEARHRFDALSLPDAESMGVTPLEAYLRGDLARVRAYVDEAKSSGQLRSARVRWLELATALRRGDRDSAEIALEGLFTHHPWAELALIMAVRDALEQFDTHQAKHWIEVAERGNRSIAPLTGGRLAMAMGEPVEALHAAERLTKQENELSVVRLWLGEVRAQANLAIGRPQMAQGVFETLAIAMKHHRMAMQLAAADVLVASGRKPEASALLASLMSDPDIQPYWLDQVLARALVFVEPKHLNNLVVELLEYRESDPLLLVYHARHLANIDDLEQADLVASQALAVHETPRVLMTLADIATRRGDLPAARRIYDRLILQGGRAAIAAKKELKRLDESDDKTPAASARGGAR